jgi:N6-L-threonylcarbamoyladenine synthase
VTDKTITILGIESSCDDTSAAVIADGKILANVIAGQKVHEAYGGVVPELASRAHQQNIVPVVDHALKTADISKRQISAIAYTRGPGLLGSLLVGASFAKSMSLALGVPLIAVNHMQAHILAHFIQEKEKQSAVPSFPFLCLTVSGGHTQIVRVNGYFDLEVLGETIDDAAGEAFDKIAKILGFPYPGGPLVDKLAQSGSRKYAFPHPKVSVYNYSFSGLKTSFLYFIKDKLKEDENFIEKNKPDICASIQETIIDILLEKFLKAAKDTGISELAIAGGVSANSRLRSALGEIAKKNNFRLYIPKFEYCTDNAAMIAMTGYLKFIENQFSSLDQTPQARYKL